MPQPHIHDEWKRSILELPDDLFFSLMRTYLGDIKTPFHKPRLVEKLGVLLSDSDTSRRITALTDTFDAEVLTAIEILQHPDPAQLFQLFQGERDYFNFHNHLMNLHERLLIYTCPENHNLYLNPYLYTALKEQVITPRLLFPPAGKKETGYSSETASMPPVWLHEEYIWGMLSYVHHQHISIKTDGTFKKNTVERVDEVFPALRCTEDPSKIYRILNSLLHMQLLHVKGASLHVHENGIQVLGSLPRPLRQCFLWASSSLIGAGSSRLIEKHEADWKLIEGLARLLFQFFLLLPEDTLFSVPTARRLLMTAHILHGTPEDLGIKIENIADQILLALSQINVLVPEGENLFLNPSLNSLLNPRENTRPLLIHPDFSVTVKPPLRFGDGLFIASLMKITSYAVYPQFELSSESYIIGRELFSAKELRRRLSELASAEIPQNINFSLEAWENNYNSVRMVDGITLILAKHWDRIVRHNPDFKSHVLEDIGHGIYVMSALSHSTWKSLLKDMGVSPLPPVRKAAAQKIEAVPPAPSPAAATGHEKASSPMDLSEIFPRSAAFQEEAREVKQELMDKLGTIGASSSQFKELSARIERKLILYPAQLQNPVYESSNSEARGIDYAGKVRIIQQSLQSGSSLLELIERTSRGKPARHLLRPKELEKSGKELVLVGEELPNEEHIRIRVEKIGYIKKWKGSLFIRPKDYRTP